MMLVSAPVVFDVQALLLADGTGGLDVVSRLGTKSKQTTHQGPATGGDW